ncbi:MAG: molecular chaperone HtpG [Oscillospiraceae bacterium]|nr:molecular chaperone HtpG [Oscillospiraceae bacterium]
MSKGSIKVNTENLLPIIKKWLYSDKDIFLREIVSNAQDAIMKLKKLAAIGEANIADNEEFKIDVIVNKTNKTLKVCDNGIGMTAEEVDKYINQVAFSGAEDFIEKYEQSKDKEGEIIGHFGLGFYSAFMVSKSVEIDTLSYADGAKSVHWESDGGTEFDIEDGTKETRGTVITLHLNEDSEEFLDIVTVRKTLIKYCGFLPVNIYLINEEKEVKEGEEDKNTPINDTHPLWLKNPNDCTEEEYKDFYHKVFMDFNEPLFHIHLNVDFPFNLKGILYFPKLNHELQSIEGQIKLFNNQVFIADNIKEVIPEYLMLLKGVIDCPDLPLNVSRSFLQNDGYVTKVSNHITKKVADKLNSLFKTEKELYEKYWDDINPFVKYGCLRDDKFYERVKDILIFKDIDGNYKTLKDFADAGVKEIYYVTDKDAQMQYINLLKEEGITPVLLPDMLDNHFVSYLEYKNSDIKFKRVDSFICDNLKDNVESEESLKNKITDIFKSVLDKDAKIEVSPLKSDDVSALFVLSEEERRMAEMSKMFGNMDFGAPKPGETFVVNSKNPLVLKLCELSDDETKTLLAKQIYDMARLSHKTLSGDDMTAFIKRSNELLMKLAGN